MRRSLRLSLLLLGLLPGCVPPATRPRPQQPVPPPCASPVVPPKQAPLVQANEDWRDLPLTTGTWHYEPRTVTSSFGAGGSDLFSIRCDRTHQAVVLSRSGSGEGPLVIQTSAGVRNLPATTLAGRITTTLAARDAFLDAIAFSRGRFVVTSSPDQRLVIPAWPEFARVVEDCRG